MKRLTIKQQVAGIVRWYGGKPADKWIARDEKQSIDAIIQLFLDALPKEKKAEITDDRSSGWLEKALEANGYNTALKDIRQKIKGS